MKNISIILIGLSVMLLSGCSQCHVKQVDRSPLNITIVLCDLTKSIDTTAILNISAHAAQMYLKAPDRTQLYYYGIGSNDRNLPLAGFNKMVPDRENDWQRKTRTAKVKAESDSLLHLINENYEWKKYQRTCVTYALKTAFDDLKEKHEQYPDATLNIVVLSDLIEDCDHHYLGRLNMSTSASLKRTMDSVATIPNLQINLAQLNIHLYMVSESQSDAIKLSRDELETAWRTLLLKYGYTVNDGLVKFEWMKLPEKLLQ